MRIANLNPVYVELIELFQNIHFFNREVIQCFILYNLFVLWHIKLIYFKWKKEHFSKFLYPISSLCRVCCILFIKTYFVNYSMTQILREFDDLESLKYRPSIWLDWIGNILTVLTDESSTFAARNIVSYFGMLLLFNLCNFFLIGIHFMQGWTAITRHGVTRKRSTKALKHTGNLFRKNLQLKGVC